MLAAAAVEFYRIAQKPAGLLVLTFYYHHRLAGVVLTLFVRRLVC